MANRVTQVEVEVGTQNPSTARVTQVAVEVGLQGASTARVTQLYVEVGTPNTIVIAGNKKKHAFING